MFNKNDAFRVTRRSIRRRIAIIVIVITILIGAGGLTIFLKLRDKNNNSNDLQLINVVDNPNFADQDQLKPNSNNVPTVSNDGSKLSQASIDAKVELIKCLDSKNLDCAILNYPNIGNIPTTEDAAYCALIGSIAEKSGNLLESKKYYQKAYQLLDSLPDKEKSNYAEAMSVYKSKMGN